MTKSEQLTLLVQTAALVECQSRREVFGLKPSRCASMAVHLALSIPEADLPDDLCDTCSALIDYVFDHALPKPSWLLGIV